MYVGHFGQLSEMFSSLRTGESLKVKVYEKKPYFHCLRVGRRPKPSDQNTLKLN